MANNVTLTELRDLCRLDAEIPDNINDTQLTKWINAACREFDGHVASINPNWRLDSYDIIVTGVETYSLSPDTYKVREVFWEGNDATAYRMREVPLAHRSVLSGAYINATPSYYLVGDSEIGIIPLGTVGAVKVFHVPTFANLVNDSDVFNGHAGWESWIVSRVGYRYARRIGESTIPWERDLVNIEERLHSQIATINAGSPMQATTAVSDWYRQQSLLLRGL